MNPRILLFALAALIGASPAYGADGPLDDPPPAAIQDPSLATSVYFPPSLATHGVARTGPAHGSSHNGAACSETNPCARLSPALDHAITSQAN